VYVRIGDDRERRDATLIAMALEQNQIVSVDDLIEGLIPQPGFDLDTSRPSDLLHLTRLVIDEAAGELPPRGVEKSHRIAG
jgi:hypothetical protein